MNMRLIINGKDTDLDHEMTISEFLRSKGLPDALVAVEHNHHWLKRDEWGGIVLKENDQLEVIRMIAGG